MIFYLFFDKYLSKIFFCVRLGVFVACIFWTVLSLSTGLTPYLIYKSAILSANSSRQTKQTTETQVRETLTEIMKNAPGRVFVTGYSRSLARIKMFAEAACAAGGAIGNFVINGGK